MLLDIKPETYEKLAKLASLRGIPVEDYLDDLVDSPNSQFIRAKLQQAAALRSDSASPAKAQSFYTDLHKTNKQKSFDSAEEVNQFIKAERERWN